jgi:hypothetical protein
MPVNGDFIERITAPQRQFKSIAPRLNPKPMRMKLR